MPTIILAESLRLGDTFRPIEIVSASKWANGKKCMRIPTGIRNADETKQNAVCLEGEAKGTGLYLYPEDKVTNVWRAGDPYGWMNDLSDKELKIRVNDALDCMFPGAHRWGNTSWDKSSRYRLDNIIEANDYTQIDTLSRSISHNLKVDCGLTKGLLMVFQRLNNLLLEEDRLKLDFENITVEIPSIFT